MGDFYSTLGVSKNADAKEIKSAYRKVAMKFHPDKNPGDSVSEEKFKEQLVKADKMIKKKRIFVFSQENAKIN